MLHEIVFAEAPPHTVLTYTPQPLLSLSLLSIANMVDGRNRDAAPVIYSCVIRDCPNFGVYTCPKVMLTPCCICSLD